MTHASTRILEKSQIDLLGKFIRGRYLGRNWENTNVEVLLIFFALLQIVLAMGNDLWVSPLVEHKVGAGGEWLQVCNLRLEIMKTLHVAENNLEHMELLYQNFETAGGTSCKSYRANAILGNG